MNTRFLKSIELTALLNVTSIAAALAGTQVEGLTTLAAAIDVAANGTASISGVPFFGYSNNINFGIVPNRETIFAVQKPDTPIFAGVMESCELVLFGEIDDNTAAIRCPAIERAKTAISQNITVHDGKAEESSIAVIRFATLEDMKTGFKTLLDTFGVDVPLMPTDAEIAAAIAKYCKPEDLGRDKDRRAAERRAAAEPIESNPKADAKPAAETPDKETPAEPIEPNPKADAKPAAEPNPKASAETPAPAEATPAPATDAKPAAEAPAPAVKAPAIFDARALHDAQRSLAAEMPFAALFDSPVGNDSNE